MIVPVLYLTLSTVTTTLAKFGCSTVTLSPLINIMVPS
jgi:hypothetical protein